MKSRTFRNFATYTGLALLILFFQNCSPMHEVGNPQSLSLKSFGCIELKDLFAQTYYPFTKNACKSCHISGGIGKGTFADSNLDAAFSAFEFVGFSRLSEYAVNPSHNPPYTGTHNTTKVNEIKQAYIKGLEEREACGKLTNPPTYEEIGDRVITSDKKIALASIGASKTITWSLANELKTAGSPVPALTAGTVEVKVQVVEILGQIAYYVSEPRIRNSNGDLRVQSLRTMINGKYVNDETTFAFIDQSVYANSVTLLSAGTSVILGLNNAEDTIALSFGSIQVTKLPPPYLGPKVNLSKTTETINDEKTKLVFDVTLEEAPQDTVVVTLRPATGTTAKARRSERTAAEPYDYYDWDYTFGTVAEPSLIQTVTFPKDGPLSQTIEVLISDDQRDENDETLIIEISAVERGQKGPNSKLTVTIRDNDDPVSNPFQSTFTKLMTGNGVLKTRCLECHNTVKKEGGYDMTDYGTMVSSAKKILVPGNPAQSEMYKRIGLQGPGRMPLDQSLSPIEQSAIEQWIMSGAANN